MPGPVTAGIDIGGTAVKIGAVDGDGGVLARFTLPFREFDRFSPFIAALAQALQSMQADLGTRFAAIGVAMPGHPDPQTGAADSGAFNLPMLQSHSVPLALRGLGLPAGIALNDAVAAAMGEHAFGAARGLSRFAMITLGTGVGGCVMIDGKPLLAQDGQPPEFGAMVLELDGPLCANGLHGTLEAFAAAAGFASAYAQAGGPADSTPMAIFAACAAGDPRARLAVDQVCRRIAQAIGIIINLLNIEACVIGGGISAAGPVLRDGIGRHVPGLTWQPLLPAFQLLLASTGNDAGWLGAAAAARTQIGMQPGSRAP